VIADFRKIFELAWLNGRVTFRPNPATGAMLTKTDLFRIGHANRYI